MQLQARVLCYHHPSVSVEVFLEMNFVNFNQSYFWTSDMAAALAALDPISQSKRTINIKLVGKHPSQIV